MFTTELVANRRLATGIRDVLCSSGTSRMNDGSTWNYFQCLLYVDRTVSALAEKGIAFSDDAMRAATTIAMPSSTITLDGKNYDATAVAFTLLDGKTQLSFQTSDGWKRVPAGDAQTTILDSPGLHELIAAIGKSYIQVANHIEAHLSGLPT